MDSKAFLVVDAVGLGIPIRAGGAQVSTTPASLGARQPIARLGAKSQSSEGEETRASKSYWLIGICVCLCVCMTISFCLDHA